MKANHNWSLTFPRQSATVSYGSKILKWKQITTRHRCCYAWRHCFLWFKDTKMKANHNYPTYAYQWFPTVSYGSKILKWKQITTTSTSITSVGDCFLWFKDTKMKANHNGYCVPTPGVTTVSYGSKILKWKQITTVLDDPQQIDWLFPMVQRY